MSLALRTRHLCLGLLALVIHFVIVGCTVTVSPSATPMPTVTATTVRTAIQTPPPITTPFPSPTPIISPAQTATPFPLLENGPWLMYVARIIQGQGNRSLALGVANLDGSGYVPLDIPSVPRGDDAIAVSPTGGYVAFTAWVGEGRELWIVNLPQRNIVRRIALFSEEVRDAFATGWPTDAESVRDGVQQEVGNLSWASNGRYLAFNGALDGLNVDVYVYDIEQDVIQRLTNEPEMAFLMEWSPDNRWIVYQVASTYADGPWVERIGTVSVGGDVIRNLYPVSSFLEIILGWTSDCTFVVESVHFESPSDNLREVNVETGDVRTLYGGPFLNAALDPQSGTVVVNASRLLNWWIPDVEEGLYRLDSAYGEPQFLMAGSYSSLEWIPQMEQFVAADHDHNLLSFSSEGEVGLSLASALAWGLIPSPDGQWLLVQHCEGDYAGEFLLYDSNGMLIKQIGEAGHIVWLPDSMGFYSYVSGTLYVHRLEGDWEAEVVDEYAARPPKTVIVTP